MRDAARADGERVLELYAGDGNFTRDLAAVAAAGVAVEGDRPAAARLRERLRAHAAWQIAGEPAARAVARLVRAGERFDVVVLDPPRAGAADVVAELPALGPARIIYVSCDPMTLSRDLLTLSRHGYAARAAWPVDMMPQTWHVEVVCLVFLCALLVSSVARQGARGFLGQILHPLDDAKGGHVHGPHCGHAEHKAPGFLKKAPVATVKIDFTP